MSWKKAAIVQPMDFLQIVALSIVQGITEFLPISSSAHLILTSWFWGWQDQGVWFDLSVHAGSLSAVLWYFRAPVLSLIRGVLSGLAGRANEDTSLAWMLVLATVPAGLCGLLLESLLVEYGRSVITIALANLVFAFALWYADTSGQRKLQIRNMTFRHALYIGLAQAIALIPGTSRSGITMTCALLLGYDRRSAAEFSFLLAIPLIAAASLFQGLRLLSDQTVPWTDFATGAVLSAVTAYVCIALFLRVIQRLSMLPFVCYRILLGLILLFVLSEPLIK